MMRGPKRTDFKHLARSSKPPYVARLRHARIHASSTMNSGDFTDCALLGSVAILPRAGDSRRYFQGLAGALKLIPITHTYLPDVVSTGMAEHYSLTNGSDRR